MDKQLVASLRRFLLRVVPPAANELRKLKRLAAAVKDEELRRQALASISAKDFHVYGGCILATFLAPRQARHYISLVAAFETAVDYLDNLCDRMTSYDESDFRALHESLIDAVTPGSSLRDYFRHRSRDDGGYLNSLVRASQTRFAALPSYKNVAPLVREVTARYCELQALKHLQPGIREARCRESFGNIDGDLSWWEGAAACGSTMPTFALAFCALHDCTTAKAQQLYDVYFPHVSAFHILLDYFIDQAEDAAHRELNFVACYPSVMAAREGIARLGATALARARSLDESEPHVFAIRAMCGFYCSRSKVQEQHLESEAQHIAAAVDVELGAAPWTDGAGAWLGPLLSLYTKVTSTH